MSSDLQSWRVFLPTDLIREGELVLSGEEHHYICHVLRMEAGDQVELSDGMGRVAQGTLSSADKKKCVIAVDNVQIVPALSRKLHVFVGRPKAAAIDELVHGLAELGVASIHIIRTDRCQNKNPPRLDRLEKIAREALRINKSAWGPHIVSYESLADFFLQCALPEICVLCDESPLYRHEGTVHNHLLALLKERPGQTELGVFVGPEASFSDEERALLLEKAKAVPVTLGPCILRVPTACLAAAAIGLASLSVF